MIAVNVLRKLGNLLEGEKCQAHGSDTRVHIEPTGYQAYPDASLVCPPIEGASKEVVAIPILIVEVLWPSTADFDRGTKFGHHRQLSSLHEYLVFWQDEPRVEQHWKTQDGLCLLHELAGIDQVLQLQSLGQSILLREICDKVDFS